MTEVESPPVLPARRRPMFLLASIVLVSVGLFGAYRCAWTFWVYRGFPAPTAPARVVVSTPVGKTTVQVAPTTTFQIPVVSSALGGFVDAVYVVLPPGYAHHPRMRYPTMYLLHGQPGEPQNFLNIGDVQEVEAALVAERRMKPMILVMPSGSPGFLIDTEWANGIRPGNEWMTFVARDLVEAIDRRFRTIPAGAARAIGGDSEGAYGALNIAFHNVGEFHVIESWSGYMVAANLASVFGNSAAMREANSPYAEAGADAAALRSTHTLIWMYTGKSDPSAHRQTTEFARELGTLHIPYVSLISSGTHDWSLWRTMMAQSLITASDNVTNS